MDKIIINLCKEENNDILKSTLDNILLMSQEFDKNEYNNIEIELEDYKLMLEKKIMEQEFFGKFPLTYKANSFFIFFFNFIFILFFIILI